MLKFGDPKRRLLTMVDAYIAVTYTYSLRGNEGLWVDGDELVRNINLGATDSPIPHVVVALVGYFKAEHGESMHLSIQSREFVLEFG